MLHPPTQATSEYTPSASANTPPSSQRTPDSDRESSLSESLSSLRRASESCKPHMLPTTPHEVEHGQLRSDDNGTAEEDHPPGPPRRRVRSESRNYTEEEEKAVIRKLDRNLVFFVAFLYMLSFLDRSNIGNARIAGLDESLSLTSSQYSWLLTSFYITYIAFEWMTLLYRIIPPRIYVPLCVLTWGLIASLQSICTSFLSLAIFRLLLGMAEAAFSPGVPFYLTFFYKRSELAYRIGLLVSAAPIAMTFASSLAWLIVKLSEKGPIEPWRTLFLVEGFPSVVTAVFAFYIIPNSPSDARFLDHHERRVAKLRLKKNWPTPHPKHSKEGINIREIVTTLLDPKAYLTALMFFSANVSFSSLPVFLPTILKDMSFSPLASQALAAPPFLCAFIFVLIISHFSDKLPDSRAWFIIAVSILSSASYTTIALAGLYHDSLGDRATVIIRYVSLYGAAMGFFSAVTLIITWALNNQPSDTGKGMGMTILSVIGQCGPLVGVKLFPEGDQPFYVRGMAICAAFMLGVAALAAGLRWDLRKRNRRPTVQYAAVAAVDDEDTSEGLIKQPGRKKTDEDDEDEDEATVEPFRFML